MYNTKRSGPKILPWGTPDTTGSKSEAEAPIYFDTLCSKRQVGFEPQPEIPCDAMFPEFVKELIVWQPH